MSNETVYREGARIRATAGHGYHDRVSDADIRQHLVDSDEDPGFLAFANAVLAIREYERVTRGVFMINAPQGAQPGTSHE